MVYLYGLGRAAAGAFVRGAAGSLGRRVGSYRRRRRVRWPSSRSRATNVKRTRTFVKRQRRVRGTRSVRRLWNAVRALQRTSDPDVTIRDIAPSELSIENSYNGFVVARASPFQAVQTQLLALGDQYKVKSFNQQLTFRLRYQPATTASIASTFPIVRHVRILYILCKDETLGGPISSIFEGFASGSSPTSSIDTLYPQFVQNPGVTYRILYDKVFSVRSGVVTQAFIRIPGSVFYDKGTVKFRETTSGVMTQQNNFLYRFIFADSITPNMLQGTISSGDPLSINYTAMTRWKYYDFGRSLTTALASANVAASVDDVKDEQA